VKIEKTANRFVGHTKTISKYDMRCKGLDFAWFPAGPRPGWAHGMPRQVQRTRVQEVQEMLRRKRLRLPARNYASPLT
jgi:hypothetical protein